MRRFKVSGICLAVWTALSAVDLPAARGPEVVEVRAGVQVPLRFAREVSSVNARLGQTAPLTVTRDVIVNDTVVIRSGSEAWGSVTAVSRPGRMDRDGSLEIELRGVCMADGTPAAVRAAGRGEHEDGSPNSGDNDGAYFLPALPVMLFLYGEDVRVPTGQEVTAVLTETRVIERGEIESDRPATGCRDTVGGTAAGASQVAIRSNPGGAEIRVDGEYVGDTPSDLRLPAGTHYIEVRRAGYQVWERSISLTAGSDVNVSAALERDALKAKR